MPRIVVTGVDGSSMTVPRIVVTDADTNEVTEFEQGPTPTDAGDAPPTRMESTENGEKTVLHDGDDRHKTSHASSLERGPEDPNKEAAALSLLQLPPRPMVDRFAGLRLRNQDLEPWRRCEALEKARPPLEYLEEILTHQAQRSPSPSQMNPELLSSASNPDKDDDSLKEIASKLVATAIEGAKRIVESQ